jgi:hypothetical protein
MGKLRKADVRSRAGATSYGTVDRCRAVLLGTFSYLVQKLIYVYIQAFALNC